MLCTARGQCWHTPGLWTAPLCSGPTVGGRRGCPGGAGGGDGGGGGGAAFQVSLEDLAGHKGSEKGARPEPSGSEEEEEEESLAVAEQVADFASSLLAALHCWHYRANALLFSRGAMVRCLFDLPSSLHAPWHVHAHP